MAYEVFGDPNDCSWCEEVKDSYVDDGIEPEPTPHCKVCGQCGFALFQFFNEIYESNGTCNICTLTNGRE